MGNIFNLNRFGKYFAHDLRNAKNYYSISLLILSLMPVIMYIFTLLFKRIITGEWGIPGISSQISAFFISWITIVLSFPVKVYGRITDKKAGSDWLLLPASGFEKWLSIVLMTCVVLPAAYGVLFFGSDALLSALIPSYGNAAITYFSTVEQLVDEWSSGIVSVKTFPILYINAVEVILFFTLGAIYFKRSKASKTILAWIGLGILASIVSMWVFGATHISSSDLEDMAQNAGAIEAFASKLNGLFSVSYIVIIGATLAGIYARIKTMKQ